MNGAQTKEWLGPMAEDPKEEGFEVKCPRCKRRVKVRLAEAEAKGEVVSACGERIELAKMI